MVLKVLEDEKYIKQICSTSIVEVVSRALIDLLFSTSTRKSAVPTFALSLNPFPFSTSFGPAMQTSNLAYKFPSLLN